jgi:hypothetical protein
LRKNDDQEDGSFPFHISAGDVFAGRAGRGGFDHPVLSQPTQTGAPGSTLTVDATVSAPLANSATVFLNFDNFGDNIPGSTIDDSSFLLNFPLILDPGGNFTGTSFSVALPPGVAPGSHTGFFEIFSGSNEDAGNPLATVNFQINATPEPGTWILLATGLGILAKNSQNHAGRRMHRECVRSAKVLRYGNLQ